MSKINSHTFNEFYTHIFKASGGVTGHTSPDSPPPPLRITGTSLTKNFLYNRYPFLTNTFLGTGNPILGAKKNLEEDPAPLEFETREEAVKWYKKNLLGERQFNELSFPDDFCDNYFVIPEEIFGKYKDYFNGMVKSLYFKFGHEFKNEGLFYDRDDCPCPSSSTEEPSSSEYRGCHHEPHPDCCCDYFGNRLTFSSTRVDVGLNSFLEIEGPKLTEIENILNSFSEDDTIISQNNNSNLIKILEEDLAEETCCHCPPCEKPDGMSDQDYADYSCKFPFKANCKMSFEFDTEEIYGKPELENRIGSLGLMREWIPDYGFYSFPMDSLYEIPFNSSRASMQFYSGGIYDGAFYFAPLSGAITLFKLINKTWTFDADSFAKSFESPFKRFPHDSTRVNDPVILTVARYFYPEFYLRFASPPSFGISAAATFKEAIEKQKEKQISENFGKMSVECNDLVNAVVDTSNLSFRIIFDGAVYIKSEKCFLCFVTMEFSAGQTVRVGIKRFSKLDDYEEFFILKDVGPKTLFSTADYHKKDDEEYMTCPDDKKVGFKLQRKKIQVEFDQNNENDENIKSLEFEAWVNEENPVVFTIDRGKDEIESSLCGTTPVEESCKYLYNYTRTWIIGEDPIIKLRGWKKSDFRQKGQSYPLPYSTS